MRKAQTELIGLVMIVILISVSVLFVIRFVALKEPSQAKQIYEQSEIASNMISALLETTVHCDEQDIIIRMNDLFRDCALFETYDCLPDNAGQPLDPDDPPTPEELWDICAWHNDGADSCTLLNCTLEKIFNNSLEVWNREYVFTAYILNELSGRGPITNLSNTHCLYGRESEIYPLPLNPGTLILQLDICS